MLWEIHNYVTMFISQVSSDFVCGDKEKKVSLYNENAKSDVEACSEYIISPFAQLLRMVSQKKERKKKEKAWTSSIVFVSNTIKHFK